jgi:integrase
MQIEELTKSINLLTDTLDRVFLHIVQCTTPKGANIENLIPKNLDIAKITEKKEGENMPYLKEGSIRKRKDGRWEIRFMDNGKQKSVVRRNQAECVKVFNERLNNRGKQEKVEKKTAIKETLFTILDKFYELDVKPRVRQGNKIEKGKIGQCREKEIIKSIKNIKKYFVDVKLDLIKVLDLQQCSQKIIHGRTRESVDNILHMALTWAYRNEFLKKNIAENFRKHKHEREQGQPFSRIEQNRILQYAKEHSKYYFAFMVYFWTGCRPSEIREIRHCDFDFERKTIFIDGTKTKLSSRRVPLFMELLPFRMFIKENCNEFVFTQEIDAYRNELKNILSVLKIKGDYTLKSTRHSFATRCQECGIDLKTISKWLGHTNTKMTDNYTHILDEFEQTQIQKFNLS